MPAYYVWFDAITRMSAMNGERQFLAEEGRSAPWALSFRMVSEKREVFSGMFEHVRGDIFCALKRIKRHRKLRTSLCEFS